MIISEIKKDKKHLMKICFDNGQEVLLDKDTCINGALKVGVSIDAQKIESLKYDSQYFRAKSRALWYLDRLDYTEKALYTKLLRAGFDKRASAAVLARLVELGLVDDRRYALRFAEKCAENNISERESFHKMLEKGVPYDLAKEVLEQLETDELSQIKALVEKKYAYKLTLPDGGKKVFSALARRGFSYSAVRQVLSEFITDNEICEEY